MGKLVCKNIYKSYGKTEVLRGIDLEIEQGKIYGLIGRNGVGKTTLMSIMTAQTAPTSGTVMYDDMEVWENQEAIDHICFSREISTITPSGPNVRKLKDYFDIASVFYPKWDKEKAEELVKLFGIDHKKQIAKLSKGMLSMATIIIGIASCADITILDEPVAGLDIVARDRFYKLLLDEAADSGRTFIISTHIIEEAANVFEEVIILKEGKTVIRENTIDLLERSYYVTGLAADVDEAVRGLEIVKCEKIGRSSAVTVLTAPGAEKPSGNNVTVQPVTLQNLFLAMCGSDNE